MTSLFSACLIAIIAVFSLLGLLAVTMWLITAIFPVRQDRIDPLIAAAISSTVAAIYPGATVTRIEEDL